MLKGFISYATDKIGWHTQSYSLPYPRGVAGAAFREVYSALDGFVTGDEKYSTEFGREIIDSIPAGSVYFGGSDPGRSIVPAMCKSYVAGDPFFTLSQNSLDDMAYLDYLRSMYGSKIFIPRETDKEKCERDYLAEVKAQPNMSSEFVYGLKVPLAKIIFEKNPTNNFFVEEGVFMKWMYELLEPHGLIFKINRQPMTGLSDETVQRDRNYWRKSLEPKIGGWLTVETPIETIAAFAKKICLQHDLEGFTGDARFVKNGYSCKMFSHERAAIAGLYAWRANHATTDSEKQRMTSEADFAFRQAWALCPFAREAVYRYVNFLISQNRFPDALLVAETAAKLTPNSGEMTQLITGIKQYQKEKQAKPGN